MSRARINRAARDFAVYAAVFGFGLFMLWLTTPSPRWNPHHIRVGQSLDIPDNLPPIDPAIRPVIDAWHTERNVP